MLMVMRQAVKYFLVSQEAWAKQTVIYGGVENAIETIYALKSEGYINYDIRCVVLPHATPEQVEKFQAVHPGYKVKRKAAAYKAGDYVVVCPDTRREFVMSEEVARIRDAGAKFAVVPPIEGFSYYGLKSHFFFGYNIVLLQESFRLRGVLNAGVKTVMDRAGAAVGLLLLSPAFVYVALQVKKDGGDIFYGHERLGQHGKTFKCWKFRSMIVNSKEVLEELLAKDADARAEWEADFKLKDDPRITKIGHFIRKTILDEIPQLWNVLRGEMSLVGPRPIVADEAKYYGDKLADYQSVKPGITGL